MTDIFSFLKKNDYLDPDYEHKNDEVSIPIYVKILAGIGAFFASVFLVIFLFLTGIFSPDSPSGLIISGIIFIGIAYGIKHTRPKDDTAGGSFAFICSLTFMAAGKGMVVFGAGEFFDSIVALCFVMLALTVATYNTYGVGLDRFLSSYLSIGAFIQIVADGKFIGNPGFMVDLMFLMQFALVGYIFYNNQIKSRYMPLAYAAVITMMTHLIALSIFMGLEKNSPLDIGHPYFINFVLSLGLIYVIYDLRKGNVKDQKSISLIIGVILLGLTTAGGVLFAFIMMAVGYYRYHKILVGFGVLFMPIYLSSYYYNLQISLLDKSLILMGSGALLIGGYVYMRFRGWTNKQERV